MYQFLSGMIAMSLILLGAFFFRFWKSTRDRLFAWFAASFLVLAIQRFVLIVAHPISIIGTEEKDTLFYAVRLVAFLLILIGILDKNRPQRTGISASSHDQSNPAQ